MFAYSIVHFNRRSSRQIQHFSTQAEKKLGQRFLETVNGVKHTRAFGRLNRDLASAFQAVDTSQRWYYANLCRQGSMLFICDLHTAVSLTALVFLATHTSLKTTQSGVGLSFWSSLCFSHALECLTLAFSCGEMALADAHDLRDATQNIPVEDHHSGIDVPASWPEHGEVIFENVTARYR